MRPFSVYAVLLISIYWLPARKESRIMIPYDGDKVVVNSLMQPDSLVYIHSGHAK